MSTIEALKMQLDALQTRYYESQVQAPTRSLPGASMDSFPMALLANQLPALPSFSANPNADEGFDDWLERLELVAEACCWDDKAKLVNLATHLCGQASKFYRSCTPHER